MLGNNNFNTYFKSNLIADCDVLIYNNLTSNLVLNRDNIKSFTMSRENDCALAFAPCDKVVIEIIGWNDLSAEAKECLSTPTVSSDDNYVWVQFQVERDVTDYCIPFIVQQCDIDIKNNNAKVILASPFMLFTDVTPNIILNSYNFNSFPPNLTLFEALQTIAVNTGQGLRIVSSAMDNPRDNEFVDMNSNAPSVAVDEINIVKDPVISIDDDKSDIEFVGLKTGTPDILYSENKRPTQEGQYYTLDFTFNFEGKQYAISTVRVTDNGGNDVTNLFDIYLYPDRLYVASKYQAPIIDYPYGILVEGIPAELEQPTTDKYVKAYAWLSTNTAMLNARNATRNFYAHRQLIEFDCRLDPRIEPLDNVAVPHVGVVKVSKVSMKFNGAFNGTIRGRVVKDLHDDIARPTCVFTITSANDWSAVLTNPNPFPAHMVFETNNSVEFEIDMEGNSSIVLNSENASALDGTVSDYYLHQLVYDLVVYAQNSDYGADSEDTVALEENAE